MRRNPRRCGRACRPRARTEVVEVGARTERRRGAGEDDRADVVAGLRARRHMRQARRSCQTDRVATGWIVERDGGHPIGRRRIARTPWAQSRTHQSVVVLSARRRRRGWRGTECRRRRCRGPGTRRTTRSATTRPVAFGLELDHLHDAIDDAACGGFEHRFGDILGVQRALVEVVAGERNGGVPRRIVSTSA